MQLIRQIDDYFIGNEEGTVVDRLYFYGVYGVSMMIALITMSSM
ncbi:hypothetical protein [Planococcus versutus]|nr:hypothetical protein [Planococcus versutus]